MNRERLTDIQREGLFHGQHGVEPELALGRIEKRRDLGVITVGRAMNVRAADLKSRLTTAVRRTSEAANDFLILQAEARGEVPSLAWPILGLLLSAALTIGDTSLLAPLLQGIGLVEVWEQRLVALLLGAGLTAFAHVGFRSWQIGHQIRGILLLATTAAAVGSICWWRCDEIVFVASLGNDTWRDFLAEHPASTRLFVIGLSVILPLAAGFISSHALPELHFASRWHSTRRCSERWQKRRDALQEELKALEIEARLAAKEVEVRHEIERYEYRIHHHLGSGGSDHGAEVAKHE